MKLYHFLNLKLIVGALLFTSSPFFERAVAQTMPVEVIKYSADPSQATNLVFLADGYTSAQQAKFVADVRQVTEVFLSQQPFASHAHTINVYAVKVVSQASGASLDPNNLINNYFGSSFWSYGIERLLVAWNYGKISGVLMDNTPFYDIASIIVNDDKYGGSGGQYAVFSTNSASAEVFIHELGHSFVNLADEYWAGPQYAIEKPNMTQTSDPLAIRWRDFLNRNEVGIYAHEEDATWYRPHQGCKMRFLGRDFCEVCSHELVQRMNYLAQVPPADAPIGYFGADKLVVSVSEEVNFFDLSTYHPESWLWTFEGGEPATSTERNPKVSYAQTGSYGVQLKVTNAQGENTVTKMGYIQVVANNGPMVRVKNIEAFIDEKGSVTIKPSDVDDGTSDDVAIDRLELSKTVFDCSDLGENTVIFKAFDTAGNEASAEVMITVLDSIKPTIKAKGIILVLGRNEKKIIEPLDVDNGSTDNCQILLGKLSQTEFTAAHAGKNTITYTISDASSNKATTEVEVVVELVLSVDPQQETTGFKLFPNPGRSVVYLEQAGQDFHGRHPIQLIDFNGRLLRNFEVNFDIPQPMAIDISTLQPGSYFLRIESEQGAKVLKFQVER